MSSLSRRDAAEANAVPISVPASPPRTPKLNIPAYDRLNLILVLALASAFTSEWPPSHLRLSDQHSMGSTKRSTGSSGAGPTPAPTLPAPPSPHKDCTIRFRLTDIDAETSYESSSEYAQRVSPFYKNGDGSTMVLRSIPVIRLFGATDKGQRVVAHVHGVYPYLYVKYTGKLDPESGESTCWNSLDR